MEKQVGIIGAGIGGLIACKHLLEKGIKPVVFEARSEIGGVWCSQTLGSTKLQTPKNYYQFSDFPWPSSIKENFPHHTQVLNHILAFAHHFNLLSYIKLNTKVVGIDDVCVDGGPKDSAWKWNVFLQDSCHPCSTTQVYQVDFVILCIGKYSDLAYLPDFPMNEGPEIFHGKVLHSMDYAAMDHDQASELIKDKKVTVVGFQKSAVDVAAEIARTNDVDIFKICEDLSQVGIHPLKKYRMLPKHRFLRQIASCKLTILPSDFYKMARGGSIILRKSQNIGCCKNGSIVEGKELPSDVVVFATGYRSEDKLKGIFTSSEFQKFIMGSSTPFYRECVHPRIPQLAILGYSDSRSIMFTAEMRSKWLAHFLARNVKLPDTEEMEEDTIKWQKCMAYYAGESGYKRFCVSVLLQIYSNDQLCKDMGCNPWRKKWLRSELFSPYEAQ
ncbi:hypothetical protein Cgig2_028192 [Carnegiea gigantea]|uniref:Flavin-containing monooxygenase n=1 Tax=Carnegiea gigantea TaxID=171969 RepID=A0A9Q1GL29_9CARY|nr:hypothetical protein Cgig2_028192 [Carnegiea gigantea]